jgi:hypothetical protein
MHVCRMHMHRNTSQTLLVLAQYGRKNILYVCFEDRQLAHRLWQWRQTSACAAPVRYAALV